MLISGVDSFDALLWLAISVVSGGASAIVVMLIARRRWKEATARAIEAARAMESRVMIERGRLRAADEAFAKLAGRRRGEILGKALTAFIPTFSDEVLRIACARPVKVGFRTTLGHERSVSISAAPVEQETDAWLLTIHCHDSAAAMEEQVAFLSRHDALTGLANMPAFVEEGAEKLIESGAAGRRMALAQIDLIRFRAINDVMGRRFGDRTLIEVAKRLKDAAGGETLIGRQGGDKFVVALPAVGTSSALAADVGRLMQAATGAVETPEGLVEVSARAAVAVLDTPLLGASAEDDAALAQTMFEQGLGLVELAMARARSEATPRVVIYDPSLDQPRRERGALALALPRALAIVDKVFAVHYQPQARLHRAAIAPDGTPQRRITDPTTARSPTPFGPIVGYESLLRCSLPGRGAVGPGELIPVAEETNAILPLGEWSLRRSCADAVLWPGGERVAVNLSPVQLRHDGVVAMVASALRESGLPPERLELEITETAMIDDLDRAVAVMTALRRLGVGLAIDDFGAGFTSLRTLKAFRFDKIKLDREFVTDVARDQVTAAIVRSVVSLGVDLGTPVLAEGVETLAALRALEAAGCAEAQGYLIGRPAPMEDLPALSGLVGDAKSDEAALDSEFKAVEEEQRTDASGDESPSDRRARA